MLSRPELSELPDQLDIPAAWRGEDLARQPQLWSSELTPEEIQELESAASGFLSSGKPVGEIKKADFPLQKFGQRLVELRDTFRFGLGFTLLRGLPVERYDMETLVVMYCGIGVHLGSLRSQNGRGHILGHVKDVGMSLSDPSVRIYQTNERQSFHTDTTDVVGLLCLKAARSGGLSMLVSTATLYNEMRSQRPDLLPVLFELVSTDRRGEIPEGQSRLFEIPVLNWYQGYLTGLYQRTYITSALQYPEALPMTDEKIEALDFFDQLANDNRFNLKMPLEPGDMQFVYNHTILHDRTHYEDWPDPDQRRHLLRLWVSLPEDRPLPPAFTQRYGSIEPGNRGGIITKHTRLTVPLAP